MKLTYIRIKNVLKGPIGEPGYESVKFKSINAAKRASVKLQKDNGGLGAGYVQKGR